MTTIRARSVLYRRATDDDGTPDDVALFTDADAGEDPPPPDDEFVGTVLFMDAARAADLGDTVTLTVEPGDRLNVDATFDAGAYPEADETDDQTDPAFWMAHFRKADDLREVVFGALGAASTCWESLDRTGVFQSDRASAIGEAVMREIDLRACVAAADSAPGPA